MRSISCGGQPCSVETVTLRETRGESGDFRRQFRAYADKYRLGAPQSI